MMLPTTQTPGQSEADPSVQKIGPVLEVPAQPQGPGAAASGQVPGGDNRTPEEKQLMMLPTAPPPGTQSPGQGQSVANGPVMKPGQPLGPTPSRTLGDYLLDTWTPTLADGGWTAAGGLTGYIGGVQNEAAKLNGDAQLNKGLAGLQRSVAANPNNPADLRITAGLQSVQAETAAADKELLAQRTLAPANTLLRGETGQKVLDAAGANPWDSVKGAASKVGTALEPVSFLGRAAKSTPYVGAGMTAFQGLTDGVVGEKKGKWVRIAAETVGSIAGSAALGAAAAGVTIWSGPGAVAAGVAAGAVGGYAGQKAGTMAVDAVNSLFDTDY